MRAVSCSLLFTLSALAAPLGAQGSGSNVTPPVPPPMVHVYVQQPTLGARGHWRDSLDGTDIRQITDSIKLLARAIDEAARNGTADAGRIGALQGQIGALEGRLGAMHGRLGALEASRGEAAAERARVLAERMSHEHAARSPKEIAELIKRVGLDPNGTNLPPQDSIATDDFTIASGANTGRVAALGQLDVFGTVNGNATSLDGDVVVHKGGHITGDALAIGGTVKLDGGTVDGEMRSLDRAVSPAAVAAASSSVFLSILDELQTVMGALVVMVLFGFAAMVFTEERLRVVASAIELRFGRSLFAGILAEVSFVPVLVLAVVLLVITLIGIILLPVAIPGLFVLGALLSVLGFLAVSRVAGQALTRRAATVSVRGAELRSMLAGLFFFFGLWLAAAVLSWVPVLGSLVHALAFVVTWAAATVGLGAAVITRGGGRPTAAPAAPPTGSGEIGWQTPTPISGIAAARRQATNTPEV